VDLFLGESSVGRERITRKVLRMYRSHRDERMIDSYWTRSVSMERSESTPTYTPIFPIQTGHAIALFDNTAAAGNVGGRENMVRSMSNLPVDRQVFVAYFIGSRVSVKPTTPIFP